MRTQYELAETTLALRWSAPSVGAAVRDACEQLGLPRASQDDAHPSLVLALRVAGTTPTAPEHAEPVADFDEVELSAHRADDHLFLQGPGVVARLDPALGAGRLELHPSALDDLEGLHGLLSGMLPVGLFALLRPRQCYPLHAAALVPVGSETDGVLLVAHRDSGKSILSYSLARQGWSFLSDDSVLLRRNGNAGVDAVAFRRRFTMDAEARDLFPEIAPFWEPLYGNASKGTVAMHHLCPGRRRERCTPRVLVFPEIADRPGSQLVPVRRKSDALLAAGARSGVIAARVAFFRSKRSFTHAVRSPDDPPSPPVCTRPAGPPASPSVGRFPANCAPDGRSRRPSGPGPARRRSDPRRAKHARQRGRGGAARRNRSCG
jgi:hypothetical protein